MNSYQEDEQSITILKAKKQRKTQIQAWSFEGVPAQREREREIEGEIMELIEEREREMGL